MIADLEYLVRLAISKSYQGVDWIKHTWQNTKLPDIQDLAKRFIPIQQAKKFTTTYAYHIAGAALATTVLIAFYYYNYKVKNTPPTPQPEPPIPQSTPQPSSQETTKPPEQPAPPIPQTKKEFPTVQVTLKCSLNLGQMSITIPPAIVPPPLDVSLTFCIDTSGSMSADDRGPVVIKALKEIVLDAQKKGKRAKITLTIIKFDSLVEEVLSTTITQSQNNELDNIISTLQDIQFGGQTNILAGLKRSEEKLRFISTSNPKTKHTFALLSDGENFNITDTYLDQIAKTIDDINAQFFVMGIGSEHDTIALAKIANKCKGTYFDTTNRSNSIGKIIGDIYQRTILSSRGFFLRSPLLSHTGWCVKGHTTQPVSESILSLGDLSPGQTHTLYIEIKPDNLERRLELKNLTFILIFDDMSGETQQLTIAWDFNSIITPQIFVKVKNL